MKDRLIVVADAFCAARGLSRARVSTLVFNDGKRLDRLAGSADLKTESWEAAMAWFSLHWPAEAEWPDGIARPVMREVEAPPDLHAAAGE